MENIKAQLKRLGDYLSSKGLVMPLFRDNGVPSLSFTLVIVTYMVWLAGVLELIKDMDIDKVENTLWAMMGLYFGRKVTKDGTKTIVTENTNQENK